MDKNFTHKSSALAFYCFRIEHDGKGFAAGWHLDKVRYSIAIVKMILTLGDLLL